VSKAVDIHLQTSVTEILQGTDQGILLQTQPYIPETPRSPLATSPQLEIYDDLVMCVLADDALRVLCKSATLKERLVLNGAHLFDDITVTHSDHAYFGRHYETQFDPALCALPKSSTQESQIAFSKGEQHGADNEPSSFQPMFFPKSDSEDPKKIEMSFDCTNNQHQFRLGHNAEVALAPFERHVFQSIFLNKRSSELWTMGEIDEDKVIEGKWWHQLGHRWQHSARVVPGMMWLNGKNHTYFAGSWTLVVSAFCGSFDLRSFD